MGLPARGPTRLAAKVVAHRSLNQPQGDHGKTVARLISTPTVLGA